MNKNKKDIILKMLCLCSFVMFAASFCFRMYFSSSMAVKNQELNDLYISKINLEKEIALLSYENSQLSSMKYIENKAKSLGFVPMTQSLLALDPKASSPVAVLTTR